MHHPGRVQRRGRAGTLTASLARSRAAQARGLLIVALTDPTDRPVQLRSIGLDVGADDLCGDLLARRRRGGGDDEQDGSG